MKPEALKRLKERFGVRSKGNSKTPATRTSNNALKSLEAKIMGIRLFPKDRRYPNAIQLREDYEKCFLKTGESGLRVLQDLANKSGQYRSTADPEKCLYFNGKRALYLDILEEITTEINIKTEGE